MKKIIHTILIVLFLAGAVNLAAEDETANMDPMTKRFYLSGFGVPPQPIDAPDFTVPDLKGNMKTLSSYKGKAVLLNFWATWCPPCRSEMPAMEKLYNELKDENFTILAVSARDGRETKDKVDKYIAEQGYTFPVFYDDTAAAVPGFYRTGSIPTSYIINKKGQVIARIVGAFAWDSQETIDLLRDLTRE